MNDKADMKSKTWGGIKEDNQEPVGLMYLPVGVEMKVVAVALDRVPIYLSLR